MRRTERLAQALGIDEKTGPTELTLGRLETGDTDWTIRFSK
jgi:hypothetical protein